MRAYKMGRKLTIIILAWIALASCSGMVQKTRIKTFIAVLQVGMGNSEVKAAYAGAINTNMDENTVIGTYYYKDESGHQAREYSWNSIPETPAIRHPDKSHFEYYCLEKNACFPNNLIAKLEFEDVSLRSLQSEEIYFVSGGTGEIKQYVSVIYSATDHKVIGIIHLGFRKY